MNSNTPSIHYQIIFVFILVSIIIFSIIDHYQDNEVRLKNSYIIFGTYQLDLKRTEFGVYAHDSLKYKKLQITFKKDMTFCLNMRVPFFLDTVGKWNAKCEAEAYNYFYYRAWGYKNYRIDDGDRFDSPWTEDSIFEMTGVTPQTGRPFLRFVYFKKIIIGKRRIPLFSPLQ